MGFIMPHSITTSIRLPHALRIQLEKTARETHRAKSWIIIQALESYLQQMQYKLFEEEARRQSLLVSVGDDKEELALWEENSDTTGWE